MRLHRCYSTWPVSCESLPSLVVVWIGYLQWNRNNGFWKVADPVLQKLHTIECRDAILAYDEQGKPVEPAWPEADVVIGNPPFLGDKKMRLQLGDHYVDSLRALYEGRVPGGADLVTYWFERTRASITTGHAKRAGLLATQGIRGGANRRVLQRIKQTGDIFWAHADRKWILDGAAVHVAMIGFDDGTETNRLLDDVPVTTINPDLTSELDLTKASRLAENKGIAFQGPVMVGPFDIDAPTAHALLYQPNGRGRPNSDVIFPLVNAADLTGHKRGWYIIDLGQRTEEEAAGYEAPFEYVKAHVKPLRDQNRDRQRREFWWRHGRSGGALRTALQGKARQIATPLVSKHRIFMWLDAATVANQTVNVITRDDDYFFGVLHSKVHELWSRRTGTQLREAESGFRYTPTSTFETFPFPWPPGHEPAGDPRVEAIAAAARELVAKRDAWLNPPGLIEGAVHKDRTLTNLYNKRPDWLVEAHAKLDRAVLDAYGWPHDVSDDEILARLLALNLERAADQGAAVPALAEVDGED